MRAVDFAFFAAFAALGCSREPTEEPGDYRVSTKNDLQWKRYAALEGDVIRALELGSDSVCTELGQAECGRVHLVPLGGNDPFESGLLQPSAEPLATTSSVVDRVLLSACSRRVALDRAAGMGEAAIFQDVDLEGTAPDPADPAVEAIVMRLYRRFLARDPEPHEVELVASLVEDENGERVPASDFAVSACFAVGSTTEFLFF